MGPGRRRAEIPEDDNHHALGALRYLIAKLDARKLGRKPKPPSTPPLPESTEKPKEKKWLSLKNEALWAKRLSNRSSAAEQRGRCV
jgi:hypothetical protein